MIGNQALLQSQQRPSAVSFLQALHGPTLNDMGGFINVRLISNGKARNRFFPDITAAAAACESFASSENVYVGVCPRREQSGKADAVMSAPGLWTDIDVGDGKGHPDKRAALDALEAFKFPPSMIVDSGGGYHAYWLFRQPFIISGPDDKATIENSNKGITAALGGDPACFDVGRILRVPGTINHKPDLAGARVALVMLYPARRYDVGDFATFAEAARQAAPATRPAPAAKGFAAYIKNAPDYAPPELKPTKALRGFVAASKDFAVCADVMRLCGVSGDIGPGKLFLCPLPGHKENNPSAALYQTESGEYIFMDFHKRGGQSSYILPEVFRACFAQADVAPLPPASRLTWWLRALYEAGYIKPIKRIARALPPEAPDNARRAYEGFVLLLELRQIYSGEYWNTAYAPYSIRFASDWCQLAGVSSAQKGLNWLFANGYIRRGQGPTKGLVCLSNP